MRSLERLRNRRNQMIQKYCEIVFSNSEKGICLDDEESILLRDWGQLNDKIISLKTQNVQQSQSRPEGNGLGV